MPKVNCWEHMDCGRGPGGSKVDELGLCPAALAHSLSSVHGGQAAGRACWIVAGTLCDGKVEGSFASKYGSCSRCGFYLKVRKEERSDFVLAATLLGRMEPTSS